MISIALSGAAGVGKTTLAKELSKELGMPIVPEVARDLLNEAGVSKSWEYPGGIGVFQEKVFLAKQRAELLHRASNTSYIADRAIIDALAYTIDSESVKPVLDMKWLIEWYNKCVLMTEMYDFIFVITWNSQPEDDGIRLTNPIFQLQLQSIIIGLLAVHNIPYILIPYKTTTEERIKIVLQTIGGVLNAENERTNSYGGNVDTRQTRLVGDDPKRFA